MSLPELKIYSPTEERKADLIPLEHRRAHRILIVDDDQDLLGSLKELLHPEGYDVRTASNAREALATLKRENISLVLADQRMPSMSGLDLLAQVKLVQPNTTRILMTGAVQPQMLIEAINRGEIFKFIAKPWKPEELFVSIHNAVQRYELVCRNEELTETSRAMNEQLTALNRCLEDKIKLETIHNHELMELNKALTHNFDRCMEICFRTLQTFYPFLGDQTRRVHRLARLMGHELNFPQDQMQVIEASAWLHDIGLAGLPADWIQAWQRNPESLPLEQAALMRQHPVIGQELSTFVYHLAEVGRIIRSHHERFDGHGYPDGLAGEEIPWLSRLLYAASGFVEFPGDEAKALAHLQKESGTIFDPEAVRVLQRCLKHLDMPREKHAMALAHLRPGMVLAEDVYGTNGWLIAPAGEVLGPPQITRLRQFNHVAPIPSKILVYE